MSKVAKITEALKTGLKTRFHTDKLSNEMSQLLAHEEIYATNVSVPLADADWVEKELKKLGLDITSTERTIMMEIHLGGSVSMHTLADLAQKLIDKGLAAKGKAWFGTKYDNYPIMFKDGYWRAQSERYRGPKLVFIDPLWFEEGAEKIPEKDRYI